MAKASINIKASSAKALLHNERVFDVAYAIDSELRNEHKRIVDIREYHDAIKADYAEFHGRKLNTKATPIREAVVNLNEHHTMADLEQLVKRINERFKIEPLHIAIHRDEGYIDEHDQKHYNFHAHIMFGWYDHETHRSLKLNRDDMREMQDIVAQSLGMERGQSVEQSGRVRLEHREYRRAMRDGDQKTAAMQKVIDTQAQIIEQQRQQIEVLQAEITTQKALQAEINALRQQLKEAGAARADYAKLEAEAKQLKEELAKVGRVRKLDLLAISEALGRKFTKPIAQLTTSEVDGVTHERAAQEMRESLISAQEREKALQRRAEDAEREKMASRANIERLSTENQKLLAENRGLKAQIDELKAAYLELKADRASAPELFKARQEIEKLKAKLQRYEEHVEQFGISESAALSSPRNAQPAENDAHKFIEGEITKVRNSNQGRSDDYWPEIHGPHM